MQSRALPAEARGWMRSSHRAGTPGSPRTRTSPSWRPGNSSASNVPTVGGASRLPGLRRSSARCDRTGRPQAQRGAFVESDLVAALPGEMQSQCRARLSKTIRNVDRHVAVRTTCRASRTGLLHFLLNFELTSHFDLRPSNFTLVAAPTVAAEPYRGRAR